VTTLRLYHGSNCDFSRIDLNHSRDKRDFSKGFYATTLREQAESWAATTHLRYDGEGKFLYLLDLNLDPSLAILEFDGITADWLEMVKENRIKGGLQHSYDIVRGPVADDDTMPTLSLYVDGLLSVEATMRQLEYSKPNDQVSLHTPIALQKLELVGKVRL
jgi:hypothetical protein